MSENGLFAQSHHWSKASFIGVRQRERPQPRGKLGPRKVSCVPLGNSERHGTQNANHCHLFPGRRPIVWGETRRAGMTPRERKDIPWILAAFAVVIIVMIGGAIFRWL